MIVSVTRPQRQSIREPHKLDKCTHSLPTQIHYDTLLQEYASLNITAAQVCTVRVGVMREMGLSVRGWQWCDRKERQSDRLGAMVK